MMNVKVEIVRGELSFVKNRIISVFSCFWIMMSFSVFMPEMSASAKILGSYEYELLDDGSEYLLNTPGGKQFIYRNYYDSYWTPVMELIGCSHKPHDTRHTCILMMTEKEVSPSRT